MAKLLISARASLHGGLESSMALAAAADNAEGLRLLRTHGGDPVVQNLVGSSPLQAAAAYGNLAAMEELLAQAQHSKRELGRALYAAMAASGGSAELVERLLGLRADVDFQWNSRDTSRLGRLLLAALSLKHSIGRRSALSATAYHTPGRTPLMAAITAAQHEGAAALIAAGARLDLRNCRSRTAVDFAEGQEIPSFLQQGLQEDPAECRRVASLAHPHGYVEMRI